MRTRFIQNDILAYLQDYRKHTMQDLCNELNISRSTCIRHLNDLSMYYNIQTFVGKYNGGVKLLGKKNIEVCLNDNELQLVIAKLESLQGSSVNLDKFLLSLYRLISKKE